MKKLLSVVQVLLMLFAAPAWAAEVSLTWDPPDAATPTGYKIYWGEASGAYTANLDVEAATTATVPDLANGKTYFFAATAYYEDGSESGYSNEVSKFLPELLPPGGLRVTGIKLNIELQGE